jgi:lysophospholipase L1-like esterase
MDRKAWLLAGLVIAAGVGLTAAMSRRPTIRQGERVLVMGDSLGVGLTTPLKGLVLGETALEPSFAGTACGGTASFQYTNPRYAGGCSACFQTSNCGTVLKKVLEDFRPTLVLVSFGTNEAFGKVDAPTIIESTHALIAQLRAGGARVIWIGPPKLPATYAGNTFRPEVLKQIRDAVLADDVPWFPSDQLDIPQFDQMHATPKGYAGWAGAIWQWLKGGAA